MSSDCGAVRASRLAICEQRQSRLNRLLLPLQQRSIRASCHAYTAAFAGGGHLYAGACLRTPTVAKFFPAKYPLPLFST